MIVVDASGWDEARAILEALVAPITAPIRGGWIENCPKRSGCWRGVVYTPALYEQPGRVIERLTKELAPDGWMIGAAAAGAVWERKHPLVPQPAVRSMSVSSNVSYTDDDELDEAEDSGAIPRTADPAGPAAETHVFRPVEVQIRIIVEATTEQEATALVGALERSLSSPVVEGGVEEYYKFPDSWDGVWHSGSLPRHRPVRSGAPQRGSGAGMFNHVSSMHEAIWNRGPYRIPEGWTFSRARPIDEAIRNRRGERPITDPRVRWMHVWAFPESHPDDEPAETEEIEIERIPQEEMEELCRLMLEAFEELDRRQREGEGERPWPPGPRRPA